MIVTSSYGDKFFIFNYSDTSQGTKPKNFSENCFLVNLWLVSDLIYFSLLDLIGGSLAGATDGFISDTSQGTSQKIFPTQELL